MRGSPSMRGVRWRSYAGANLLGGLLVAFVGLALVGGIVSVSPFSMPVTLGILVAGSIVLDYYHDNEDNS